MVDSYMWGKVERISPEAPIPIVSVNKYENRIGGAANVALNIQALGATPIICSVIGDDEKGNIFFELLKKRNISREGILIDSKRKTTVKTRIISNNQHLLRIDEETDNNLSQNIEKEFVSAISKLLSEKEIQAVIFEDYDKGVITPYVIEKVIEIANSKNIPTFADPKKRNFLYYKNVTLFKPNFKEFSEGLNLNISKNDFEAIYLAAKQLHQKSYIKLVLITLSESGIFISDKVSYKAIPAQIRDIADVSGAGDTIIGVACLCMIAGLEPSAIAAISNLAGGLVCEKVGVVPIDKEQLLKECLDFF